MENSVGRHASPVKIYKGARTINDVHTDVVITDYGNTIFILVTQRQKIGTLITIKKEEHQGDGLPVYHIDTLLGLDDPEIHVVARYMAEKLNFSQSILLGLCLLEKPQQSTVEAVTKLVDEVFTNKLTA